MRKRGALFGLLIVWAMSPATAEPMTWTTLEKGCTVMGKDWCEAYALGALQMLEETHLICPDHPLSGADALKLTHAYAVAHPDIRLEGISGFIHIALTESYSCKGWHTPKP